MAAVNTVPIVSKVGDIQWNDAQPVLAENDTDDLTSGTIYKVFTADATNGGFVQRIRFRPIGTNTATIARIWISNTGSTGTALNNVLWDEITLAATTESEVAALALYELPLNFALPPGYRIHVTLKTAVAAGYHVSVIGGKY